MKDYKKLYKELLKEVRRLKKEENNFISWQSDTMTRYIEEKCSSYASTCLDLVLQIADELEGKKWHNMIMNIKQFKENKKK